MQGDYLEGKEMNTEQYDSSDSAREVAGEVACTARAQIQPLTEELCRLMASILRRALEDSNDRRLTTGGSST
jgi:hypothetical protein